MRRETAAILLREEEELVLLTEVRSEEARLSIRRLGGGCSVEGG